MKTLEVKVVGNIATYDINDGKIVCDNDDYVIHFDFDDGWDEFPNKVARFITEHGYEDVEFTGDTCDAPAIRDSIEVIVGVFSKNGSKSTTTGAKIPCYRSILSLSKNPTPEYVMPDIEKVMAAADTVDGLVPQVVDHQFRIGSIEKYLDIAESFTTVSGFVETVAVPTNARKYAKINKIGGFTHGKSDENGYSDCDATYIKQVKAQDGTALFTLPDAVVKACDELGLGAHNHFDSAHSNYIYFENGRVYYNKGCRTELYDYEAQEGETVIDSYSDYASVVSYAEPIIADITDLFDDPYCCYIEVEGVTSLELEIAGYDIDDGWSYGNESFLNRGFIEVVFEV